MLKSSLCYYNDAYKLVSGTVTVTGRWSDQEAKQADERRKKGGIFENCALFII